MDDRFNTIAGWVLFAGIIALGFSILSSKYFHADSAERPEVLGYVIEGVVTEDTGAAAEMTMAEALNMDTPDALIAAGERVFAKCQACHTVDQGGANGIGPNLYATMGATIGNHSPGFAYSSALQGVGGVWDWETMNAWLKNPRGFADGTTMSFAGLNKIEDRAAVAMYLNSLGSNLEVPSYVADAAEEAVESEDVVDAAAEDVAEETAAE
ncbi:c-type cytochrome [Altererythrobacter lutimaris]|uniref:C-type cytochrome n=1 Tax=Altererythrobacter lutimaris TaxID=2743979 RepID=A0A850HDE8_9SPHN|nr:c-type cytochrome [Altererythrobacter lutimaris]NVE95839.1 c-type cytochrome [Altererythrobacter lutimaris]